MRGRPSARCRGSSPSSLRVSPVLRVLLPWQTPAGEGAVPAHSTGPCPSHTARQGPGGVSHVWRRTGFPFSAATQLPPAPQRPLLCCDRSAWWRRSWCFLFSRITWSSCSWGRPAWVCPSAAPSPACWPTPRTCCSTEVSPSFLRLHPLPGAFQPEGPRPPPHCLNVGKAHKPCCSDQHGPLLSTYGGGW